MKSQSGSFSRSLALAATAAAFLVHPAACGAGDDPARPATAGREASEKPGPPDWGDVFGTNEGKPIDSGFVFYDGRYVEAPYRVSRRGVGLYVNHIRLSGSSSWPPMYEEDRDPGMPPGLTRDSTFADLQLKDKPGTWSGKRLRWLKRHHTPEEARRLYVQYLKDLPFVAKVEVVSGDELKMTTHAGETIDIVGLAAAPYVPPTKEQVIKRLEDEGRHLEGRLEKGDCFLMYSKGGEISFGQRKAAEDLPLAVEILSSNRTATEKADLLERMVIVPDPGPMLDTLVSRFQPSAQLSERLRALTERTGIKPRTMQEIPAETLRQITERMLKKEKSKKKGARE